MALAMRDRVSELKVSWLRHGYELSLVIGIAKGFATIGAIGFEGRIDYGALGKVTNLAARLCGEAQDGQILTNRKSTWLKSNLSASCASRASPSPYRHSTLGL
jgi:adenylate cyclase